MDDMLKVSGTELARMIRDRETTSGEVVEAHIAHLEKVNPTLNAVVATRLDAARAEAVAADRKIESSTARDKLPPFLGVPCTIKECFALAGMPNTSGIVARKGVVTDRDATAVARLRAAGAIPLGVTNTSEGCMWMETSNRVYGRTNNPYDLGHIVGGSSGGEGAIIASGASPFGVGSDIGGSIRMPAFFNGVFGHKATGGLVPGTGQFPFATGPALRYLTTGPLVRRAEDLWPLLNVLAGPDGQDAGCTPWEMGDPAAVDFSKIKVLVVRGNGVIAVADDMLAAQRKAADALAERGAQVTTGEFEALRFSRDIWSSMLAEAGGPSFSEIIGDGAPIGSWAELAKWLVGRSAHTFPAIGLTLVERLPKLLAKRTARFAAAGRALKKEVIEKLGPNGLLLYPSYPTVAPVHNKPMLPPFNWVYTAILNVLEVPVTQVPLGLNAQGLPLGVQVASVPGNDHVTIAAALALEHDLGGWVPPARW